MTLSTPANTSPGEMGLLVSDHITAMLAYWDTNQVCRFANNAYIEWFGKSKEEMIGKITMKELLGPLYEKNLPHIKAALAGEKQVFEREIPVAGKGIRHSLATYTPHIANNQVKGFFVHVADVTYIKELEAKLLKSKQEMLRHAIEAQEKERISIEHTINENISQMLVYSKLLLSHNKAKSDPDLNDKVLESINHAIRELKLLSLNLTPAAIKHFGFIIGTEDYIENLKSEHPVAIEFEYNDKKIEALAMEDKLSVFRIIQNFILLMLRNPVAKHIGIRLNYNKPHLGLTLSHDDTNFLLSETSNEFMDIEQRLEYYGGKMRVQKTAEAIIFQIDITIDDTEKNAVT
ncbi:PAS domain-containing protein [Ferruginibacter profundus]